jgi:2-methylcitrate dehydratase
VFFQDGTSTEKVICEYPIGHRERRTEGIPKLVEKFESAIATRFPKKQQQDIIRLFVDTERLDATPAHHFMEQFVI